MRTVVALADIKVKEHDYDALTRGIERFLPPRFMTVNTALRQLREIEEKRGEGGAFSCCSHDMQWLWLACDGIQHLLCAFSHPCAVLGPDTRYVGLARVGQETQKIVSGSLEELVNLDFGPPLHSVIIVGETHELEDEVLATYAAAALPKKEASEEVVGAEAGAEAGAGAGGDAGAGADA